MTTKVKPSGLDTVYAPVANPTFTGTVAGVTKAMVGLGSVDNTADAAKNVLYATSSNTSATCSGNAATATTAIPAAWNSIGSYVMAICVGTGPFSVGQTVAGTGISACSAAGAGGTNCAIGTWRCHGYASTSQIGLFIRIS